MGVRVDAHLLDTQTGIRAVERDDWEYESADAAWWDWVEGNSSCDCNRLIKFVRQGLLPDPAPSEPDPFTDYYPCGEGRFVLERLVDRATGAVIYPEPEG